jgi:hypothetical protein
MAAILGGVFFNIQAGKYVSAGILGAGFTAISAIYGGYMYTPSGDLITSLKSGPWPPTINVCPDFLSLINIGTVPVCVDPIGVGGLRKWTTGQSGADYIFDLSLPLTNQRRIDALCDLCKTKKLTWEGVYDGSACLNNQPPIPTSA